MDLAQARRRGIRGSRVNDSDYFPFEGGLNLVDTPLKLRPGQVLAAKNYEPGIRGGYRSLMGYERYDGRLEPSTAHYWIVDYQSATTLAGVGQVLNQVGGANAVVLAVVPEQPISIINLAPFSDDFTASGGWTAAQATVTANVMANPLTDTVTVDLLREDTNLTEHSLTRTLDKVTGVDTYWLSLLVHAQGRTRGQLLVGSISTPVNYAEVRFDILNRAISAATSTAGFVALGQCLLDMGNGWYRIGIKFQSSSEPQMQVTLKLADSGAATTYRGDGVSGMHLFGLQMEVTVADTDFPSSYVPTDSIPRGNGTGYYVLGRLSGSFVADAGLRVESTILANAASEDRLSAAANDDLNDAYTELAVEDARAQIGQVPGSGSLLGVVEYNGVAYAFRNTSDGTAARMFKATTNGWQPIALGFKLRFDAGAVAINEGDTIRGNTSNATAVVRRVVVTDGDWGGAGPDAASGYLIIGAVSGGAFQDNEPLVVNAVTVAAINGVADPQVLAPNGRYEFRVHNFYGHTGRRRLYGVDGVNRAFEFDDSPESFVQIETGMTIDAPNHIGVHQNQLWLSFPGGSVQKSSVGSPELWQVSLGAAELGIGDEVTGFLEEIGNTLFVFARNSTTYITGDGDTLTPYRLKPFNAEVGAMEGSIQRIGKGVYMDDRGISTLASSQNYGNYSYNSISALIQPLIKQLKLKVTTSVTVKDDNLYRLFFDDGRFISVGFQDKKISGFMACEYGQVVRCAYAGEDSDGEQLILFGSDSGYVYRAERGTSFDGEEIETFLRPVYFFSRSPSRRKHYRRAQFDIRVSGPLSLDVAVDYSFGDSDDPVEPVRTIQLGGGGGYWGQAVWGAFKWGAGSAPEAIVKLEGAGINIGFLIASKSKTATPHSVEGVALHHSKRRVNRGDSYA
jgi:hypothetical protein